MSIETDNVLRSPSSASFSLWKTLALIGSAFWLFSLLFLSFLLTDLVSDYQDMVHLKGETLAVPLKQSLENHPGAYELLMDKQLVEEGCDKILSSSPDVLYCRVTDKNGLNLYNRFVTAQLNKDAQLNFSPKNGVHFLRDGIFGNYTDVVIPFQLHAVAHGGTIRLGLRSDLGSDYVWPLVIRFLLGLLLFTPLLLGGVAVLLRRVAPVFCPTDNPTTEGSSAEIDKAETPASETQAPVIPENTFTFDYIDDDGGEDAIYELEMANHLLRDSYEALEVISRELGQSRDMYQALLDQAADPLLVGDKNDSIVFCNRKAQFLFGCTQQDLLTRNLFMTLDQLATDEDWNEQIYSSLRDSGRHVANASLRLPHSSSPVQGILEAHQVQGRSGQNWTLVTVHLPTDVW